MQTTENMVMNAEEPPQEQSHNYSETSETEMDTHNHEEEENYSETEYASINAQLDELNSALDFLESKNDSIKAELMELWESNVETRKQFQESKQENLPNLQKETP